VSRIYCIQHVPFESPAAIGDWAAAHGHELSVCRAFEGDPIAPPDRFDALVVMGGPMGVHDDARLPWLIEEKNGIQAAILAGRQVLGVCLGAQLIAHVLGARVHRNRFKEIGWFRVEATEAGRADGRTTLPPHFVAFHWHGDTFDLPAGAVHLARSEACEFQAFSVGTHILGIQFHLEMGPDAIDALIDNCGPDLGSGPYVQSPDEIRAGLRHVAESHALLDRLLDGWMKEDS
jgi:GMP synthase-like glutamine amidotransferase